MLQNEAEYESMYLVEDSLWWYRHLHDRVVEVLREEGIPTSASILDAGCGTGGLLQRLHQVGYFQVTGFDYNPKAVELAQKRAVGNIFQWDIQQLSQLYPPASFDVIISNDVWYQFADDELMPILESLVHLLRPGGLLISNNQAYDAFRGMHDVAVGAKRRFHPAFFEEWLKLHPTLHGKWVAWSRGLAPLIWCARSLQRLKLKYGFYSSIKSDVSLPPSWINRLFYQLVSFEKKLVPSKGGWGSSLFFVAKKENNLN